MPQRPWQEQKNLIFSNACDGSSALCIQDVLCYISQKRISHFIRFAVEVELPLSKEEEAERKVLTEKGLSFAPKTKREERYVLFSGDPEVFTPCSEEYFRQQKLEILTDLPEGWARKSSRHISGPTEERFLVDLDDFKKKTAPQPLFLR